MTKPHDKGTTLPAFADQIAAIVRRGVEDATLAAEASVLHTLGTPLRLVREEMLVLAARKAGWPAETFEGLGPEHFSDASLRAVWVMLGEGASDEAIAARLTFCGQRGEPLLAYLGAARLLDGSDVRETVEQLIMAAAWREHVNGILLQTADFQARVALGQRGVIEPVSLRARMRALALDLVAGLEVDRA